MYEKVDIEQFKIKWKDFLASNSYGDLSKEIRLLLSECERYEKRIKIMYELNYKMGNEVKELEEVLKKLAETINKYPFIPGGKI